MAGNPQGHSGDAAVLELQQLLVKHGYMSQAQLDTGPGVLGAKTRAALARVMDGAPPIAVMEPADSEPSRGSSPTPSRPPVLTPRTHRIRPGDTLSKLALDYDVSLESLIEVNRIQDPRLIWVGQELTIPRADLAVTPRSVPPPPTAASAPKPSAPKPSPPKPSTPKPSASQGPAPKSPSPTPPASSPVATSGAPSSVESTSGFCFPFPTLPGKSWKTGARAFGANRSHGKRKHAGCDLYFPKGTWIHAVADGEVIQQPYNFYCGTQALEIRHGSIVVRYGEIKPHSFAGGTTVKRGQRICQVGHLIGVDVESDMLHIEIYSGSASGALTVAGKAPFMRRKDLVDPTPYLDLWAKNLPST